MNDLPIGVVCDGCGVVMAPHVYQCPACEYKRGAWVCPECERTNPRGQEVCWACVGRAKTRHEAGRIHGTAYDAAIVEGAGFCSGDDAIAAMIQAIKRTAEKPRLGGRVFADYPAKAPE